MEPTYAYLQVTSPSFDNNGPIPSVFTCDGNNTSPGLHIRQIPADTVCMALIMDDPDAPGGVFDHWIEWNIPPGDIVENTNPGISGVNSSGKTGYHGPCPPDGTHRYFIHIYALSRALDIPGHSPRQVLEEAMKPFILAKATLMGTYQRL